MLRLLNREEFKEEWAKLDLTLTILRRNVDLQEASLVVLNLNIDIYIGDWKYWRLQSY